MAMTDVLDWMALMFAVTLVKFWITL